MKKQRTLTREKICQAGLAVIHVEGLEGLSMRRLACELKVEAASLYNHIESKSALLDLIQDHLFQKLPRLKKTKDWKKYLCELAHLMRRGLLQFPKVVPLFATRPSITPFALVQTEQVLRILHAAGFQEFEALFAYQSLCIFVLGHLQAEVGHVPGAQDEKEPSFSAVQDAKNFPHFLRIYSQCGNQSFEVWFDFGLKMIIAGLELILKQRKENE